MKKLKSILDNIYLIILVILAIIIGFPILFLISGIMVILYTGWVIIAMVYNIIITILNGIFDLLGGNKK